MNRAQFFPLSFLFLLTGVLCLLACIPPESTDKPDSEKPTPTPTPAPTATSAPAPTIITNFGISSWHIGLEGNQYYLGSLGGSASVPIIDSNGDGNYNDEVTVTGSIDTESSDWVVVVQNATSGIVQVFSPNNGNNVSQSITFVWKTGA